VGGISGERAAAPASAQAAEKIEHFAGDRLAYGLIVNRTQCIADLRACVGPRAVRAPPFAYRSRIRPMSGWRIHSLVLGQTKIP